MYVSRDALTNSCLLLSNFISFHFRQVRHRRVAAKLTTFKCNWFSPSTTREWISDQNEWHSWLVSCQLFRTRWVHERLVLLPHSIRRRWVSKDPLFLPCGIFLHIFPLGSDQLDPAGHVYSCRIPSDEEKPIHHQSLSRYHPKIFVFPSLSGGRFAWCLLRRSGNPKIQLTSSYPIFTFNFLFLRPLVRNGPSVWWVPITPWSSPVPP